MGVPARIPPSTRDPTAGRPVRSLAHRRWRVAGAILPFAALLLLGLLTLPSTGANGGFGPSAGPLLAPAPGAAAGPTLSLANATVASSEPAGFWGVNVRPYSSLGADASSAYAASGLEFVRWPGGAVVDRYNVTSNEIYNEDGTTYVPPSDVSDFAQWCRSVACHAIIGLPAEIDRPSTAAYYVAYIEQTVGFTPDYWEIGNEPSIWTHFGSPWNQWTASQDQNATPSTYAIVLHQYIAAIRTVDPQARLIGLGGVGTGSYGESSWISAAVRENGPNLSAISIHVYPAGGASASSVSVQQFYSTLSGNSALSVRVPTDRAAIGAACPLCHIALIVSELGSGTGGGPDNAYMAGFAVVPYLAAEFAQALQLNLSQVDLYAFESSYAGSMLSPSGQPTDVGTLYRTFLEPLRSEVLASDLTDPARGFYVLATRAGSGGATAILIANTNVTSTLSFQLRLPWVSPSSGSFTVWSPAESMPGTSTWTAPSPTSYRVGPESVGLIVLNGVSVWSHASPTATAPVLGLQLALPPTTAQGLLAFAAPTSLTFPCWAVATARRKDPL